MARYSVLVVVQHELMRKLLLELMNERLPDVACTGVGTRSEALRRCADLNPAVLVFDAGMHCRRGGEFAVRFRAAVPRCGIIALTTHALGTTGADIVITKDSLNLALAPAVSRLLTLATKDKP